MLNRLLKSSNFKSRYGNSMLKITVSFAFDPKICKMTNLFSSIESYNVLCHSIINWQFYWTNICIQLKTYRPIGCEIYKFKHFQGFSRLEKLSYQSLSQGFQVVPKLYKNQIKRLDNEVYSYLVLLFKSSLLLVDLCNDLFLGSNVLLEALDVGLLGLLLFLGLNVEITLMRWKTKQYQVIEGVGSGEGGMVIPTKHAIEAHF